MSKRRKVTQDTPVLQLLEQLKSSLTLYRSIMKVCWKVKKILEIVLSQRREGKESYNNNEGGYQRLLATE